MHALLTQGLGWLRTILGAIILLYGISMFTCNCIHLSLSHTQSHRLLYDVIGLFTSYSCLQLTRESEDGNTAVDTETPH